SCPRSPPAARRRRWGTGCAARPGGSACGAKTASLDPSAVDPALPRLSLVLLLAEVSGHTPHRVCDARHRQPGNRNFSCSRIPSDFLGRGTMRLAPLVLAAGLAILAGCA